MATGDKNASAGEDKSVMFVAAGFIGIGVIGVVVAHLFGRI